MLIRCIAFFLQFQLQSIAISCQCPYQSQVESSELSVHCAVPPANCPNTPFQSFDGSCNNLEHPDWGMSYARYGRLVPAQYDDQVSSVRRAKSGRPLPNARLISDRMFSEEDVLDDLLTVVHVQFGQVLAHDNSLRAGSTSSLRNFTKCCTDEHRLFPPGTPLDPRCFPIAVPFDDHLYAPYGRTCLGFMRSITDLDALCWPTDGQASTVAAEQLNIVTAYMDLGFVYGNSAAKSGRLRSFVGGRMAESWNRMLKQNVDAWDLCDVSKPVPGRKPPVCMNNIADQRPNQNPHLGLLSVLFQREHNRLADELGQLNPHWGDEKVFQVARRINVATYQKVAYYEWMPLSVGRKAMLESGLMYEDTDGEYVNDYDWTVNAATLNEHSNGAFRFSHNNVENRIKFLDEERQPCGPEQRLRDWFDNPKLISIPGNIEKMFRGMCTQLMQKTDNNIATDIHGHMFEMSQGIPNQDLIAMDIQRGRDHGLARYNDYRVWAGLKRATCWKDMLDVLPTAAVRSLRRMYDHWDDCDLMVAASMEYLVPGTQMGPTFQKIVVEHFLRCRQGDRFFFEHGECEDIRFSIEQLTEIRKASMARFICDNTDVQSMQREVFKKISYKNPLVSCAKLPRLNLNAWKDGPSSRQEHTYGRCYNEWD